LHVEQLIVLINALSPLLCTRRTRSHSKILAPPSVNFLK